MGLQQRGALHICSPEKASIKEPCSTSYRCVCMSSHAVRSIFESASSNASFYVQSIGECTGTHRITCKDKHKQMQLQTHKGLRMSMQGPELEPRQGPHRQAERERCGTPGVKHSERTGL